MNPDQRKADERKTRLEEILSKIPDGENKLVIDTDSFEISPDDERDYLEMTRFGDMTFFEQENIFKPHRDKLFFHDFKENSNTFFVDETGNCDSSLPAPLAFFITDSNGNCCAEPIHIYNRDWRNGEGFNATKEHAIRQKMRETRKVYHSIGTNNRLESHLLEKGLILARDRDPKDFFDRSDNVSFFSIDQAIKQYLFEKYCESKGWLPNDDRLTVDDISELNNRKSETVSPSLRKYIASEEDIKSFFDSFKLDWDNIVYGIKNKDSSHFSNPLFDRPFIKKRESPDERSLAKIARTVRHAIIPVSSDVSCLDNLFTEYIVSLQEPQNVKIVRQENFSVFDDIALKRSYGQEKYEQFLNYMKRRNFRKKEFESDKPITEEQFSYCFATVAETLSFLEKMTIFSPSAEENPKKAISDTRDYFEEKKKKHHPSSSDEISFLKSHLKNFKEYYDMFAKHKDSKEKVRYLRTAFLELSYIIMDCHDFQNPFGQTQQTISGKPIRNCYIIGPELVNDKVIETFLRITCCDNEARRRILDSKPNFGLY